MFCRGSLFLLSLSVSANVAGAPLLSRFQERNERKNVHVDSLPTSTLTTGGAEEASSGAFASTDDKRFSEMVLP
jgi:hypothetical protein